jgi:hypothetical protein
MKTELTKYSTTSDNTGATRWFKQPPLDDDSDVNTR